MAVTLYAACPFPAVGAENYGDARIATVLCVYDGDTMRVNIDDNWPPIIGRNISIRINGIDTPEMKDTRPEIKALAIMARDFVRNTVFNAQVIEIRNIQRGKYFRIVADLYADGVNVADELLAAGLAHKYDGGTKSPW